MYYQTRKGDHPAVSVAEYVRMSTDHQRYSIENQRAAIRAYAAPRNMTVLRTYTDAGKSGVTLKGRSGLSSLLAEVVTGAAPFTAVLVYDVSRWGRFQDADESAHYEFLCRRAGVSIIYCAEPFAADTTPLSSVLKSLKRAMAGEFSRELGVKVSARKARLGKLGFRNGGLRALDVSTSEQRPGVLLVGGALNLRITMCRRQTRHEHDGGGWRICYQRDSDADLNLAARFEDVANSPVDYLLVPRADLFRLPKLLRRSHETLLAPYSHRSIESVSRTLVTSIRRQTSRTLGFCVAR